MSVAAVVSKADVPYQGTSEVRQMEHRRRWLLLSQALDSFRLLGFLTSASAHPHRISDPRDNSTNPLRPCFLRGAIYGSFIPYTRTSDLPRAICDFQGLVKAGLRSPTLGPTPQTRRTSSLACGRLGFDSPNPVLLRQRALSRFSFALFGSNFAETALPLQKQYG